MAVSLPTLFIGSSREALPAARAVARRLAAAADVTLWTDDARYKRPGEFFLDALAGASGRFDFAVLVFGNDDGIVVRGKRQSAPRDNVVFELGLFWGHLGRERTFVLVPKMRRDSYRILSDLQGLTLSDFVRPRRARDLESCLEAACQSIAERIASLGRRDSDRGPKTVSNVSGPLEVLMREAHRGGKRVEVRNIALDMEATWPMLRDLVLAPEAVEGVTWRSLMVDPASAQLRPFWSDTVSRDTAALAEANMKSHCSANGDALARRGVRFECRAYSSPPTVHGFLFNDSTAFISLCGVRDGRLVGAPNPYVRIDLGAAGPRSEFSEHLIAAFGSWFEHHWQHGSRPVWPV